MSHLGELPIFPVGDRGVGGPCARLGVLPNHTIEDRYPGPRQGTGGDFGVDDDDVSGGDEGRARADAR